MSEFEYNPRDKQLDTNVASNEKAKELYMQDQGIEKYSDEYYADENVQGMVDQGHTNSMNALDAAATLRDERTAEQTYNYRDSNPYGSETRQVTDVLKEAEDGGKGFMGFPNKPLNINQMMRKLVQLDYSDAQIRDTIAKTYSTTTPAEIKWDYTGE